MTLFRVLVLSTLGLLSACQTAIKPSSPVDSAVIWRDDEIYFDAIKRRYESLRQWQYTAKIAVTTPAVREVATMVWNHADDFNDIRLFGPLGIGAVRLQFDDQGVVLFDSKGRKHVGDSAQALLTGIVGWPIPMDALSHWLSALPDFDAPYRYQLNENGVAVIEQFGWNIKYSSYRLYGDDAVRALLPRKITAMKVLPDKTTLVVKLIAKSWEL